MTKKKNIVWLASYPKSGNTWFRAFLTALFSENKEVNINNLFVNHYFGNSTLFEYATAGFNASEMHISEVDNLKSEMIEYLSSQSEELIYVKIHEKYSYLSNDSPIISDDFTHKVIYLVRNPLDVAVSYAHHDNLPLSLIIKRMNKNFILGKHKNPEFFNIFEQLGSWSEHVSSWLDNQFVEVEVIRYEDMHTKSLETFRKAIQFIGLSYSPSEIEKAIKSSNFENLQKQELKNHFKEKNPNSTNFFRKGKIGSWKEKLSEAQANIIISNHKKVMHRLNYLTKEGCLIF